MVKGKLLSATPPGRTLLMVMMPAIVIQRPQIGL